MLEQFYVASHRMEQPCQGDASNTRVLHAQLLAVSCKKVDDSVLCSGWPKTESKDLLDPRWRAAFRHAEFIFTFPHLSIWMRTPSRSRVSYTAQCCAILAQIQTAKGRDGIVSRMKELSRAWREVGWTFIDWKRFIGRRLLQHLHLLLSEPTLGPQPFSSANDYGVLRLMFIRALKFNHQA